MAGGPTITVRQIASYPAVTPQLYGSELVLLQQAGQGGPYATTTTAQFVATALQATGMPAMGVGITPPANALDTLFAETMTYPSLGGASGGPWWNAYYAEGDTFRYWQAGVAAHITSDPLNAFYFQIAPAGQAGAAITGDQVQDLAVISMAGDLSLRGTLTVARDPTGGQEVATAQWVGANTVASFNGRRGVVQLTANDVYSALCLDPCDPFVTQSQSNAAICNAINQAFATKPLVTSWNGRLGAVWLNVCDLNIATFSAPAGIPPLMVPTPPQTTATPAPDPTTVVNIQWIETYLSTTAGLATEEWVNQQIANALLGTVSSFNNRTGAVALQLADVTGAGGAPITSPAFGGIPTAPTAVNGTSTAQLATTAFVMNTITALTPGVVSFNGRAGTVTLSATDINNAGGALLASPNFTGVPAAPTAAQGTSTSQIATTQFVMQEIAATTAGVASWNGRTGVVTMTVTDIETAGGAPAASPALTGTPTAPTAANGTSTTQLATTAFVMNEIAAVSAGVTTWNGRSGAVTLTANDLTAVGGLTNPSAALTGTPTAPTPAPTDSSTNIATTAFVHAALANYAGATVSAVAPTTPQTGALWFNTGASPPQLMVYNGTAWVVATNTSAYAPLASPALTGNPTAPTPAAGNSSTSIATTAFVAAALAGYLPLTGGTLSGALSGPTITASSALSSGGTLAVTGNSTLAGGAGVGGNLSLTSASGQLQFPFGATGGIRGDNGTSNAAAGIVGEWQSVSMPASSTTSGTVFSTGGISLSPGDWDVWGQALPSTANGTAALIYVTVALTASQNNFNNLITTQSVRNYTMGATQNTVETVVARWSPATQTVLYMTVQLYSADGSAIVCGGLIWARRRR